jgi:hypothetical protein
MTTMTTLIASSALLPTQNPFRFKLSFSFGNFFWKLAVSKKSRKMELQPWVSKVFGVAAKAPERQEFYSDSLRDYWLACIHCCGGA